MLALFISLKQKGTDVLLPLFDELCFFRRIKHSVTNKTAPGLEPGSGEVTLHLNIFVVKQVGRNVAHWPTSFHAKILTTDDAIDCSTRICWVEIPIFGLSHKRIPRFVVFFRKVVQFFEVLPLSRLEKIIGRLSPAFSVIGPHNVDHACQSVPQASAQLVNLGLDIVLTVLHTADKLHHGESKLGQIVLFVSMFITLKRHELLNGPQRQNLVDFGIVLLLGIRYPMKI